MTMQKDDRQQAQDVTAEDEAIAGQVTQTDDVPVDVAEPEPEKPLTRAELAELLAENARTIENRIHGRNANYTSQQLREFREQLRQDFNSRAEEQRVAEMEPEQQVEYWRQKALKGLEKVSAATERRDTQAALLSESQQQAVVLGMRGFLEGAGADPELVKNRALWEGWEYLDDPTEVLALAKANYRKITAQSAKPAAVAKPAPAKPAPSTNGAPKKSASDFQTRADIMAAFADGDDERVRTTDDVKRLIAQLNR